MCPGPTSCLKHPQVHWSRQLPLQHKGHLVTSPGQKGTTHTCLWGFVSISLWFGHSWETMHKSGIYVGKQALSVEIPLIPSQKWPNNIRLILGEPEVSLRLLSGAGFFYHIWAALHNLCTFWWLGIKQRRHASFHNFHAPVELHEGGNQSFQMQKIRIDFTKAGPFPLLLNLICWYLLNFLFPTRTNSVQLFRTRSNSKHGWILFFSLNFLSFRVRGCDRYNRLLLIWLAVSEYFPVLTLQSHFKCDHCFEWRIIRKKI